MTETVKVGSIFYTSWGYDQTNVDYYEVVALSASGKTATLMQVKTDLAENGSGVVPVVGSRYNPNGQWCKNCRKRLAYGKAPDGSLYHLASGTILCLSDEGYEIEGQAAEAVPAPTYKKRIRVSSYDGRPTISWNSYSNATLWDGTPKFDTIALGYTGH